MAATPAFAVKSWRWEAVDLQTIPDATLAEWEQLAERCRLSHSAGPSWMRSFARAFLSPGEARAYLLYADGRLVAAVPLAAERGRLARRLVSVDNEHSPYFAFALDLEIPGVAETLLERLLAENDYLFLRRFYIESPACAALVAAAKAKNLPVALLPNPSSGDAFITLRSPWEAFLKAWSRSLGKNARKNHRKLAESGNLTVAQSSGGPELPAILDECFELETRGWKGQRGTPIKRDPRTLRFYTELAHAASAQGALVLFQLRLDGKLLAFDFTLRGRKRIDSLKISYDPEWASNSPGTVLGYLILEREEARKEIETFHLGRPSGRKRPTDIAPLGSLRIYAATPRGRLAYLGGPVVRGAIKKMPGTKRAVEVGQRLLARLRKESEGEPEEGDHE